RAAAARRRAESGPARESRVAAVRERRLPRDRERAPDRIREAHRRQPDPDRGEPRSVHAARRARDRARLARSTARLHGSRPAPRRDVQVADRPQLRPPRSRRVPRPASWWMSEPGHWFERDPNWFKTAIFYEIHIRGFFDGNDDGSGDFRGLIEKLDFLQWLGIDCIWLLPMYQSPLRDGGYDIADFYAIH